MKDVFRQAGYRTVRAGESRYRGQDERDYLRAMYAGNEVFVTADQEFIEYLFEEAVKRHAGVVWIPKQLLRDEQVMFAEMASDFIRLNAKEAGRFAMRGIVLYPSQTGLSVWDGDRDELVVSWARMRSG